MRAELLGREKEKEKKEQEKLKKELADRPLLLPYLLYNGKALYMVKK